MVNSDILNADSEYNQLDFIRNKMNIFYSHPDNQSMYFDKLMVHISRHADLALTDYREKYIHRRLYYRLQRLNIETYKKYLEYLNQHPEEIDIFKEIFTIHVTEFFRDVTPFRYLEKELFLDIYNSKRGLNKEIKILCAPCSTGEEAYSLAIICDHLKKTGKINCKYTIYACDIEQKVINDAKVGIYHKDSLKNISIASLNRNFIMIDKDYYEIQPRLKQNIIFFTQDLLKNFSIDKFDLITCRNFLIYVSKDKQKKIIENLKQNLNKMGYIMLGKTEGFQLLNTNHFRADNIREHIYQYFAEN